MDRLDSRTAALEEAVAVIRVDLERIGHELRSLEHRLDSEAAGTAPPVTGSEREVGEARNVLAEVRREHERVRVRFQMISRYEERLRRVEDAAVKLYGGNLRGPMRDT
jgi:hypothetical protein